MFTKNDEKRRWVNGTLGRVVGLEKDLIRVEVLENNHQEICEVERVIWESYKYEYDHGTGLLIPETTGYYIQFPLMLAWAVTIHKSQGKTLDHVCLDLGSGAFDYGQVYVALSRCRSLNDIYLVKPIRETDIKCDPVIRRFYEALNSQ
jgi:ATP-dependent exoDNAse (exonuclease V) alpha subunit